MRGREEQDRELPRLHVQRPVPPGIIRKTMTIDEYLKEAQLFHASTLSIDLTLSLSRLHVQSIVFHCLYVCRSRIQELI